MLRVLVTTTVLCAVARAGEDWSLTLAGALPGGKDLVLCLAREGGELSGAFGLGPRFSRGVYVVASRDLRWQDDKLSGSLTVTIASDGYVPPPNTTIVMDIALDASATGQEVKGTFTCKSGDQPWPATATSQALPARATTSPLGPHPNPLPQAGEGERSGAIVGTRQAGAAPQQVRRLTLWCDGAILVSGAKTKPSRLMMVVAIRDGKSFSARLVPPGSIVDVGYASRRTAHEVRLDGARLSGIVEGEARPQGGMDRPLTYRYELAGTVIGAHAAGTLKITENGKDAGTATFHGPVTYGATDPADGLMVVTLHDAVHPHNFLNLYLSATGGAITHGFGTTPNFNNSTHPVDLTGLKLADGRLAGKVGVTITPDPWIPRDRKPIAATYEIDAAARDGQLLGSFTGRFGGDDVRGAVDGNIDARPDLADIAGMTIKLEDGLVGGSEWQNRAFLGLQFRDGKFVSGKISNNHTKLNGTVQTVQFKREGERITVDATGTVGEGGSVTPGKYSFHVEALLVGAIGSGRFVTTGPDGQKKPGQLWISVVGPK